MLNKIHRDLTLKGTHEEYHKIPIFSETAKSLWNLATHRYFFKAKITLAEVSLFSQINYPIILKTGWHLCIYSMFACECVHAGVCL